MSEIKTPEEFIEALGSIMPWLDEMGWELRRKDVVDKRGRKIAYQWLTQLEKEARSAQDSNSNFHEWVVESINDLWEVVENHEQLLSSKPSEE